MLKVFISIDWYLPGTNAGGPVRSVANLVAALPSFNFFIVTRNTDYCSTKPYQGISFNCWVRQSHNCHVYYASSITQPELTRLIHEVRPQCLYVNGVFSKKYSRWPVTIGQKLGIKTILAPRGMLSPHSLKVKPYKKYPFVLLQRLIGTFSKVHFQVTAAAEAGHVKRLFPTNAGIHTISNLPTCNTQSPVTVTKRAGMVKLLYLGRIAPEKGTLEAIKALAGIKGSVELQIFGTCYNQAYWQACQAQMALLPGNCRVHYGGALQADSPAFYKTIDQSHALLLPSYGENFGHSIVECLSRGRPVIISTNTPWQNMAAVKAGMDVPVSQLPACIDQVLNFSQEEYDQWVHGAFDYYVSKVVSRFGIDVSKYKKMFFNEG